MGHRAPRSAGTSSSWGRRWALLTSCVAGRYAGQRGDMPGDGNGWEDRWAAAPRTAQGLRRRGGVAGHCRLLGSPGERRGDAAICRATATAERIGGPSRPAQRGDFVDVGASLGIANFLCRRARCRATRAICQAKATAGRIGGPPRPAQRRDFVVVGASLGIAERRDSR